MATWVGLKEEGRTGEEGEGETGEMDSVEGRLGE